MIEDSRAGQVIVLSPTERRDIVDRLTIIVRQLSKPRFDSADLVEERRTLEYQLAADSFNPAPSWQYGRSRLQAA